MNDKKYYHLNCAMSNGSYLKLSDDDLCQDTDDLPKKKNVIKARTISQVKNISHIISGQNVAVFLPDTAAKNTEAKSITIAEEPFSGQILSFAWHYEKESSNNVLIKPEDCMNIRNLAERINFSNRAINKTLNSLFAKNIRVRIHSKRVGEICKAIATEMNLAEDDIHQISLAGIMHDIGKIAISEEILEKPGTLDSEEVVEIRKHSEIGCNLLRTIDGFSKIADCILEHHERWDGQGYPNGLCGEDISLQARIIAVADSFDAMTSDRPYRETVSNEDALTEIRAKSGTQFDPVVVKAFLEMQMLKG